MAWLVPAIHVFQPGPSGDEDVDPRDKPGMTVFRELPAGPSE